MPENKKKFAEVFRATIMVLFICVFLSVNHIVFADEAPKW